VFVGYALGDPDLLFQIEFSRDSDLPKSYAVSPGAETDRLFVKRCDGDNIDVLSFTALDFLRELDQLQKACQKQAPTAFSSSYRYDPAPTHADDSYRNFMREDFRWIDFKGIPVLGGQLRISIDDLFVPLSGVAFNPGQPPAAKSSKSRPTRSKRMRLVLLESLEESRICSICYVDISA
jgi:hypothetical protein